MLSFYQDAEKILFICVVFLEGERRSALFPFQAISLFRAATMANNKMDEQRQQQR